MRDSDRSDEATIARWLQQAAREESHANRGRRLPSASQLWWKAQILRKLAVRDELAERATRPARWSQWAGLGLACLMLAFFTAWFGYDLLAGIDPETLNRAASAPLALVFLLVAGTLVPLLAFGVFWTMWREI